ncbi:MAG: ACT domain-containing protein [Acholeplasmatales bacterium]|nr:ACT domain-containing protein [Acholeplasmatales bacterium]
MIVKQLSIFIENKAGSVSDITNLLGTNNINIRSLQIADSTDFGILRLIVDNASKALELVKASGYTAKLTDVISVVVPDKPNGLNDLLKILSDNNIEINYLYVFIGKNNLGAEAILKAENIDEVEAILLNNYY